MTNEQIKAEAIKAIESVKFFAYSEVKLDAAIERGLVDGDVLQTNGPWKVTVCDNTVVCKNEKGETQGPVMSLNDKDFADKCLIMLVINAARIGG